ncbi:MAG TPA: hypothetical protein VKA21_02305 [Candidatus Binatia bacterium]|nr:hypothetical protein [Candidatus Binatia bacterium]
MSTHPALATLQANPAEAASVPLADVPRLLEALSVEEVRVTALRTVLGARLAAGERREASDDRLLTLDDAAARLSVTPDWLKRQKRLPFRIELSDPLLGARARRLDTGSACRPLTSHTLQC